MTWYLPDRGPVLAGLPPLCKSLPANPLSQVLQKLEDSLDPSRRDEVLGGTGIIHERTGMMERMGMGDVYGFMNLNIR